MRIDGSSLEFVAQHAFLAERLRRESLRVWVGDRPAGPPVPGQDDARRPLPARRPDRPANAAVVPGKPAHRHRWKLERCKKCEEEDEVKLDPKWELIRLLVEKMIGRKIRLRALSAAPPPDAARAAAASPPGQARQGWGIEYDLEELERESEQMRFAARGTVRTAEGREIRFDLVLNMSREFVQQRSVHLRAGDATIDPLVVNLGGAAQLAASVLDFDLDADGRSESIPFVGPNSGVLVLDGNDDGRANDGRELFGPSTGDGFAELAALDADGNGWVDEADPSWTRLRLWTRDGAGTDAVRPLGEAGIGALAVARATTPFEVKDSANALLGRIVSSGVYLHDDGSTGTLQQVNVAV